MNLAVDAPPLWTAAEAAVATGGKVKADWHATGVSIDTRTIQSGDLFVALSGPNHDGHAFVNAAFEAGASAAMVSREDENVSDPSNLLVVADVEAGLRALALTARARTSAKIVGVTGSVGKTGTKEMLIAAFARHGRVSATAGNLNNHFGLPLSLARMPKETDYGIFEMGMNHAGEIAELSRLVRPHIAIITAVAAVHIEFFESVEGIADAKSEIFEGLESGGTAILNHDNEHFARLRRRVDALGISNIISFGANPASDVRLIEFAASEHGSSLAVQLLGTDMDYVLQMRGRHWAMNSLAVLAAVHAAGVDVEKSAVALSEVAPSKGRGRIETVQTTTGAYRLIDETYNASPIAVRAAFDVLADTVVPKDGRRIVVLGDMLELGEQSDAEHRALARDIADHGFDRVFACGPFMSAMFEEVTSEARGAKANDAAALAPHVVAAVRPGDVVLIKGSAGSQMARVVAALRDAAQTEHKKGGG